MPGARDGQLRVRRGTDDPPWALQMFDDDELGLWLTLAQADVEDDVMRAGIPILRGPYVVDVSDIPHDGDKVTLWTPVAGDVILRLFANRQTVTRWDSGYLAVGQDIDSVGSPRLNIFAASSHADWIDNISTVASDGASDGAGDATYATALVCTSTAPIQVQLWATGGTDPTVGHVELYALVARAVAP